jgi:hypothetical protein
MVRGWIGTVLGGICLAATLLFVTGVRAEGVPSPRIDIPVPDIRASIIARLNHPPPLPMKRAGWPLAPGEHAPGTEAAPNGVDAVRRPAAPTPPEAPSMNPAPRTNERPLDTSVHRVVDPNRRDDHVQMPDKSVTVRTLDDLDRLEAQYFQPKKSDSSE